MTAHGVGYAACLALGAAFVFAAVAKLRDRPAVAAEFDAMGVRSANGASLLLPWMELAVAALLLAIPWIGAGLALAMLCGFSVVLVRHYRSGAVSGCSCFGASVDQPVGLAELVRNGFLMVLAVVGVAAERAWPGVLEFAVVMASAVLVWGLIRVIRAGR